MNTASVDIELDYQKACYKAAIYFWRFIVERNIEIVFGLEKFNSLLCFADKKNVLKQMIY